MSRHHLDRALSNDNVPADRFDRVEKLIAGQVVDAEIDLLPVGLAFHPAGSSASSSAAAPARDDDARDP